jgi:hypothetical protein
MNHEDETATPGARRRPRRIPPEVQRRNEKMEKLFVSEGWTYDRIAREYGITRERVRQVLKKRGAADVAASKKVRRDKKATEIASKMARFDASIGPDIRRLLRAGVPAAEAAARLQAIGTHVTEEDIRSYAARHHLGVPYPAAERFSSPIVRLAVLAAAADQSALIIDESEALAIESEDLAALASVSNSPSEVKALAARAATAKHSDQSLGITKDEYDAWRRQWLDRYPKADSVPWPPTSQTIRKRLGGQFWNEAVKDAGLTPHTRGRSRGALIYRESNEYLLAVAEFLTDAESRQGATSFAEYERWATGRAVPSPATIRNIYRTWTAAKAAAAELAGVGASRRVVSGGLRTDVLIDRLVQVADRLLADAVDTIPIEGHKAAIILATKEAAGELLGDLVREFEEFRRLWIYDAIREDPSEFFSRLSPGGSASTKEKQAWADIAGASLSTAPEAVISSKGLDALLSGRAGDLTSSGGWLATNLQARLNGIPEVSSIRWRLFKTARNVLEHRPPDTAEQLEQAFRPLDRDRDDGLWIPSAPRSAPNLMRWLIAEKRPTGDYEPNRLSRSRLGYLHELVAQTAIGMRTVSAEPDPSRSDVKAT